MKTVVHNQTTKSNLLHIETDLAVIDIQMGQVDSSGASIVVIEIWLDDTAYFDFMTKESEKPFVIRLAKNK